MKLIIAILMSIVLTSCMGTSEYYKSQTEFYKAQTEANKAYMMAMQKPIAEMVAPDGTTFRVNNVNIQQPQIQQMTNPVVDGLKTVINSTPVAILSGGWAVKEIVRSSTGTITNGAGTVTTNSNNQPQVVNADGNIDQSEHTATPTVVNQPAPTVVTQPAPLIVPQPSPVIVTPEIVKPEVIYHGEGL
ncbi:MAG: hypothetical protein HQK67_13080 [Desulfamplus sp.]|nr:hypothetical protein [Desulfamplus sp.]